VSALAILSHLGSTNRAERDEALAALRRFVVNVLRRKRVSPPAAEDISQEVVTKLWRAAEFKKLPVLANEGAAVNYMATTIHNTTATHFRKAPRELVADPTQPWIGGHEEASAEEDEQEVAQASADLWAKVQPMIDRVRERYFSTGNRTAKESVLNEIDRVSRGTATPSSLLAERGLADTAKNRNSHVQQPHSRSRAALQNAADALLSEGILTSEEHGWVSNYLRALRKGGFVRPDDARGPSRVGDIP
jgi:DNA-directed RNA polymerase specialized sigma24 family protein